MFKILVFIGVVSASTICAGDVFADKVSTNPDDVRFYLYPNASKISDRDVLVYSNASSVLNSRFRNDSNLIVLVHGFTDDSQTNFPVSIVKAYHEVGFLNNSNIVVVDWGKLSGCYSGLDPLLIQNLELLPIYLKVVSNVPIVAKRLQQFLVFLQDNKFISGPDRIHIVGHSLGAHISGFAGSYYIQHTNSSIARISGVDPAGPSFQGKPPGQRLDNEDAVFVDIMHTNERVLGYCGPIGDVDFFVNGGGPMPQPECELVVLTDPACSHNMATSFYAASIRNSSLTGFKPSNFNSNATASFGEYCPSDVRGLYDVELILPGDEMTETWIKLKASTAAWFSWFWNIPSLNWF